MNNNPIEQSNINDKINNQINNPKQSNINDKINNSDINNPNQSNINDKISTSINYPQQSNINDKMSNNLINKQNQNNYAHKSDPKLIKKKELELEKYKEINNKDKTIHERYNKSMDYS